MSFTVREKLIEYLRDNGIKQEYVAEKANLSSVAMSNLANGKRGLDVEEYVRICHALGVSTDLFMPDNSPPVA